MFIPILYDLVKWQPFWILLTMQCLSYSKAAQLNRTHLIKPMADTQSVKILLFFYLAQMVVILNITYNTMCNVRSGHTIINHNKPKKTGIHGNRYFVSILSNLYMSQMAGLINYPLNLTLFNEKLLLFAKAFALRSTQ